MRFTRCFLLLALASSACAPRGLRPSERVVHVREPREAACEGPRCTWTVAELLDADGAPPRLTIWTGGTGRAPLGVDAPASEAEAAAARVRAGGAMGPAGPLPAPVPLGAPLDTPAGPAALALARRPTPPGAHSWTLLLRQGDREVEVREIGPGEEPHARVLPVGEGLAIVLLDLPGSGFTLRDAVPVDLAAAAARLLADGGADPERLRRAVELDPASADLALRHAAALAEAGRTAEALTELGRAVAIGGEPLRIRARRMEALSAPAYWDVLRPREVRGFDRAGGRE